MDMRPDRCNNWHFKLPEPEVEAAAVVNEAENELNEDEIAGIDQSEYNLGSLESD